MSKQIVKLAMQAALSEREETNRDIILSYLESGGVGVELSDFQQELLERWERADDLIKRNVGKKNREEIANMLRAIYKYHRATAYRDMMDAEYVFSSSKPWNKKYLIGLRIEYCLKRIRDAQLAGDTKFEAAMEQSLQRYIEMYPDDLVEPGSHTVIFNIDNRSIQNIKLPDEETEAILDNAIINLPNGKHVTGRSE